jgi:hypothetical protein
MSTVERLTKALGMTVLMILGIFGFGLLLFSPWFLTMYFENFISPEQAIWVSIGAFMFLLLFPITYMVTPDSSKKKKHNFNLGNRRRR